MSRAVRRHLAALLFGAVCLPVARRAHAQQQQPVTGYAARSAARENRAEADAATRRSPESAAVHSRALSAEPHMAGTPAQARTRDYVAGQMRKWGLDTDIRTYSVYMPHPTSVRLWRVAPEPRELSLAEGPAGSAPVPGPQIPAFNGYGAAGDVTGEVVYVNYGLIEDYRTLDSLGVSVRGRIAVARYGRSYRGIKAREAERNGALGLVLYSDPAQDGFTRGDVYPEGPMRPSQGVQRGSVYNGDEDPTTPGYPSIAGARRIPLAQAGLPRIPVIPVSYANAMELLRGVQGKEIPEGWQGAMPFTYHIGPGPVRARLAVATDEATKPYKDIWNVIGGVRGSEFPDEVVMIGAHRDSWGPGAADDISGTVSMLEAARTIGEQVRAGMRPRRTILFASWDAEEWAAIGSAEFAEQDSARLARYGIAYLNQDENTTGPSFGAGGSPSLRPMLRDVLRRVASPAGAGSVYAAWRAEARPAADTLEPEMSDPGGGSDFAAFYNHLGIPILDFGFGGRQGIYHSAYDSNDWMSRFGDPGFRYHATSGLISATTLLRLANADILPYDYVEYARYMRALSDSVASAIGRKGWNVPVTQLAQAIGRMENAARDFNAARDVALALGMSPAAQRAVNEQLTRVERSLTRPTGLRRRPWYRNLIFASDEDNGYSTMSFPSVSEAVRAGDRALATTEMTDLAARFDAAAQTLRAARAALSPK